MAKRKITSSNQKGGITAHTINIAATSTDMRPPRSRSRVLDVLIAVSAIATIIGVLFAIWTHFNSSSTNGESDMSSDGKINVTSINQHGGITANTVNFGTQPRTLTADMKAKLKSTLSEYSISKIEVQSTIGDNEALQLNDEITSFVKSLGYEANSTMAVFAKALPASIQLIEPDSNGTFQIRIGPNR